MEIGLKPNMDLLPDNEAPILQASADDLAGLWARGLAGALVLSRNYGDWLRLEPTASGMYRLTCYEAVTGKAYELSRAMTGAEAQAAAADYFEGHWKWRQSADWRERST